jgi:hypothetical protein
MCLCYCKYILYLYIYTKKNHFHMNMDLWVKGAFDNTLLFCFFLMCVCVYLYIYQVIIWFLFVIILLEYLFRNISFVMRRKFGLGWCDPINSYWLWMEAYRLILEIIKENGSEDQFTIYHLFSGRMQVFWKWRLSLIVKIRSQIIILG